MAKAARLIFAGLGTAVNFAFNPLISGSILIFSNYAPGELQAQVHNFLAPYISTAAIGRLITFCTFSFWGNIVARLNWYLSWRSQNNWVEDEYDWRKEIVLITGASNGIGERVAELLAEKKIKVIALDIQPLKEPLAQYDNVHFYHCDLTDYSTLASVAARIRTEHGDPTVVFNNAGIGIWGSILDKNITEIQKIIDLNIVSHFSMVQQFLPAMVKNNHGHVIAMASMASYMTIGSGVDYCAAKAGVAAFHEGLRQELKRVYKADKVRTSIVHPSWVSTTLLTPDARVQLRKQGHAVMKLDYVAVPITNLILSGYSEQLLLPNELIIKLLPGFRGWPHWLQEVVRGVAQPW